MEANHPFQSPCTCEPGMCGVRWHGVTQWYSAPGVTKDWLGIRYVQSTI
jgi:hypothetical protein